MLSYILEVTVCLAAFYTLYSLVLSRETFFGINRWYLLGTLLLSIVIPLLPELSSTATPDTAIAYTLEPVIVGLQDFSTMLVSTPSTPWWLTALLAIYWGGVALMTFRFIVNLQAIWRLYYSGEVMSQKHGSSRLIMTETELPFSFFNWIFLPREHQLSQDALNEIIRHESAHSSAWHSIDIMTMELAGIFFWPSPMIYFYRKSMRRVHEYLADAVVLQDTPVKQYGHLLLSQTIPGMQLGLANHFFNNQLKQRIIMMTKQKSRQGALMKYVAFLPVLLITIALFAFRSQPDNISWKPELTAIANDTVPGQSEVYQVVEEMPRFPGCEESGLSGQELHNCSMQKMLEHLYSQLEYPKEAKEAGAEGRTIVQFIVRRDGNITDAKIVRSIGHGTDAAVLELINKMPRWRPGYQEGKAVDVQFTLPVVFKLQDDDKEKPKTEVTGEVYQAVEEMPRFPGCEDSGLAGVELMECSNHKLIDFIIANMRYPEEAKKAGVEGRAVAEFIVAEDGSIKDAKIVKSIGYGTDAVVLGILNQMPAWQPGKQNGKAVNVKMALPIQFALPKAGKKDEGLASEIQLEVFPVPSKGTLNYQVIVPSGTDDFVIDLVDQNGRSVFQEVQTLGFSGEGEFSGKIETKNITSGTYVLRVIRGDNIVTRTVVIQ